MKVAIEGEVEALTPEMETEKKKEEEGAYRVHAAF